MQIEYTNKHTVLVLLLLLFPTFVSSQVNTKRYYVTNIGDTTEVLMDKSGLKAEASAFLLEGRIESEGVSNTFERLRDAASETNRKAEDITVLKNSFNTEDNLLGVDESRRNIERNRIEREIERLERKQNLFMDTSEEEKAFLKNKFGDKPSYFINGMSVDESLIQYLPQKEILSKSLRVANTVTGNPNGEVWYVVTQYALDRFGLSTSDKEIANENIVPATNHYPSSTKAGKLSKQQQEVEALKEQINAVRVQQGLRPLTEEEMSSGTMPDEDSSTERIELMEVVNSTKKKTEELRQDQINDQREIQKSEQQREIEELRRSINELRMQRNLDPLPAKSIQSPQSKEGGKNKVQKKPMNVEERIVTYHDSPLEKAKHQQDETPKRSVRKIKERERNK